MVHGVQEFRGVLGGSVRDIDGPWSSGVQVDVGSLGKDTYGPWSSGVQMDVGSSGKDTDSLWSSWG